MEDETKVNSMGSYRLSLNRLVNKLGYVCFSVSVSSVVNGKSGVTAFDRKAAKYGVQSIEKAFPSLDVIVTHRMLSPAGEALRRVFVVRYGSPHSPAKVARDLATVPEVSYAEPLPIMATLGDVAGDEPNGGGFSQVDPNDQFFPNQIHLARMNFPAAWGVVKGQDSTVVIAIVDGGTNWRHPDLEGNVWSNPNEIPDNGTDDDGNGFIDDVHGWDFNEGGPDPSGPVRAREKITYPV